MLQTSNHPIARLLYLLSRKINMKRGRAELRSAGFSLRKKANIWSEVVTIIIIVVVIMAIAYGLWKILAQ